MANTCFPDFYKAVSKDVLRPSLTYGVVYGGYMIATNSHALVFSKLSEWIDDAPGITKAEQLQNLEGVCLSGDVLKKLANPKVNNLIFDKNCITMTYKNGVEQVRYSGYSFERLGYKHDASIDVFAADEGVKHLGLVSDYRLTFQTIDAFSGELQIDKQGDVIYFKYPNIFYKLDKKAFNKIDMILNFKECVNLTYPRAINPKMLADVSDCFRNKGAGVIIAPDKQMNKASFILPADVTDETMGNEFAIIMPNTSAFLNAKKWD